MGSVSVHSTVVAAKQQASCRLADEVVVLELKNGVYYSLNPVGALVWELVQQPRRVQEIREALVREYEVDHEECERDLLSLLQDLVAAGLIEAHDGDSA